MDEAGKHLLKFAVSGWEHISSFSTNFDSFGAAGDLVGYVCDLFAPVVERWFYNASPPAYSKKPDSLVFIFRTGVLFSYDEVRFGLCTMENLHSLFYLGGQRLQTSRIIRIVYECLRKRKQT